MDDRVAGTARIFANFGKLFLVGEAPKKTPRN
jgi:hypothetical protein